MVSVSNIFYFYPYLPGEMIPNLTISYFWTGLVETTNIRDSVHSIEKPYCYRGFFCGTKTLRSKRQCFSLINKQWSSLTGPTETGYVGTDRCFATWEMTRNVVNESGDEGIKLTVLLMVQKFCTNWYFIIYIYVYQPSAGFLNHQPYFLPVKCSALVHWSLKESNLEPQNHRLGG